MKSKWIAGICALAGGLAFMAVSPLLAGQQKDEHGEKGEHGEQMGGHEAMMEMWAKLNEPGPEHARFKRMEGKWKTEVKFWQMPGMEPEVSYGSATFKTVLGGRYLEEEFHGESDGKPFEGRGFTGYDNIEKKYQSVWMDSMSTSLMVMEGTYDPATKTETLAGKMHTPAGKQTMRIVSREVSEDKVVADFYWPDMEGKEYKGMAITYTRM